MRVVVIGCTHGRHHDVVLPKGDVLVHTGDYSRRGDAHDVRDFLSWFEIQPFPYKVFVNGNHDGYSEEQPEQFARYVADYAPSATYLNDSGAIIMGLRFWGSPVTPSFCDWWWNRDRGPAIKAHWDLIPRDTQVLITHGPPHGILDEVMDVRKNQGCRDLLDAIDDCTDLRAHFFSHLHLNGGQRTVLNDVYYINAAMVDEGYQLTRQPQVVWFTP